MKDATYVALTVRTDLSTTWGFLTGKRVDFVVTAPAPTSPAIAVEPETEFVFYALDEHRVLIVARELLNIALGELAPDQLKVKDVRIGDASFGTAALAQPIKLLGFALGEELQGLTADTSID